MFLGSHNDLHWFLHLWDYYSLFCYKRCGIPKARFYSIFMAGKGIWKNNRHTFKIIKFTSIKISYLNIYWYCQLWMSIGVVVRIIQSAVEITNHLQSLFNGLMAMNLNSRRGWFVAETKLSHLSLLYCIHFHCPSRTNDMSINILFVTLSLKNCWITRRSLNHLK